jgi:DNA-binding CsgD family transcriptional regulator
MLLVHFDKPDGARIAAGPARESLALARVIGGVGQRDFSVSALSGLSDVLPLCWMSIYTLRIDQPPLFHGGASLQVPDRTTEAFHFYRQGIYLTDRTFDAARQGLKSGQAGLTHCHAQEIPQKHRQGIYTRNGLRERASLVRIKDDGSLLAINLYRSERQGAFHDADIDVLCRLGEPLFSCVNLHMRLSGAGAPADEGAGLPGPLKDLPRREREVCDRLLRGWTYEGVAADLGISAGTVKTYRDRAFERLGLHHRNELFALALAWSAQPPALPDRPGAGAC